MLTCTCSIASSEIGATPVRSPGWPPRPNELLKAAPLTVMLFMRLSAPPNELVPEVCGVRRVKSLIRPRTVGSDASVSRLTEVAAPVRPELNTVSDCAVTVTVSVTAIGLTSNVEVGGDAEVDLDVLDSSPARTPRCRCRCTRRSPSTGRRRAC